MSILEVKNLSHGFGDRAIFEDVSFRLLKGEHIGLVGANGEGKSTFMSIVAGKMQPDEGKVEWSKYVTAGYLDQHSVLEEGQTVRDVLRTAFDELLVEFIAMRGREGEKLQAIIQQRLDGITVEAEKVRSQMPAVLQWQRERLLQRFEEAKIQLDPQRVEQEMILLAQRVDVAEELDRLQMHVKETNNILKKGGAVGRKLDFMMQELNRESNTLASKSINADITASAVELKVLIEQMREQIQNLE